MFGETIMRSSQHSMSIKGEKQKNTTKHSQSYCVLRALLLRQFLQGALADGKVLAHEHVLRGLGRQDACGKELLVFLARSTSKKKKAR